MQRRNFFGAVFGAGAATIPTVAPKQKVSADVYIETPLVCAKCGFTMYIERSINERDNLRSPRRVAKCNGPFSGPLVHAQVAFEYELESAEVKRAHF